MLIWSVWMKWTGVDGASRWLHFNFDELQLIDAAAAKTKAANSTTYGRKSGGCLQVMNELDKKRLASVSYRKLQEHPTHLTVLEETPQAALFFYFQVPCI